MDTCRADEDREYYGDYNEEAETPQQQQDDDDSGGGGGGLDDDEADAKRWMDKFDTDEYAEDDDDEQRGKDDQESGGGAGPSDHDDEAETVKTHKTPDELIEDNPQVAKDYYDTPVVNDEQDNNNNNKDEDPAPVENASYDDSNNDDNNANNGPTVSPYSHRAGVLREEGDSQHYDGQHDRTFPSMMVKVYRGATTRTVANDTFAPWSYFIKFPPEDEAPTATPKPLTTTTTTNNNQQQQQQQTR